jgi:uncharacterized protein
MKIFSLTFFISLLASPFAQKINKTIYEDQTCYVYPFTQRVHVKDAYFSSIDLIKHRKLIISMFEQTHWKNFSPEQRERALVNFEKEVQKYRFRKFKKKNRGKINNQLPKAIRKNPFPLLEQQYELSVDIKPCLDPIPDGRYVQYFEDFALIDEENQLTLYSNKVAGVFHFKNNLLEGEAIWMNFKGDTLKKGCYKNGLKEGEWRLETRELDRRLYNDSKVDYVKKGAPYTDTVIELVSFSKGVKQGPYSSTTNSDFPQYKGFYAENKPVGLWEERIMKINNNVFTAAGKKTEKKKLRHNTVVTDSYHYSNEKIIVKQPLIRDGLIFERYQKGFNFEPNYDPIVIESDLYTVAFEIEKDLELEEEYIHSYEGDDYSDYDLEYGYEDEYYGDYDNENYSSYTAYEFDKKNKVYLKRGKAIDSLGLVFNFQGVYERHYPNGQLMFRYVIEEGKLLKEDTLFWDNGKAFDVIQFLPDSNQYIRSIYDYEGKLYQELSYDSLGDFKRINFEPVAYKYVLLDGLLAKDTEKGQYYIYNKQDTLSHTLTMDSVVLWKSWNKEDSTAIFQQIFYPEDRILSSIGYSMTGSVTQESNFTFNEDFKSWTGDATFKFKNLTLKSTKSASYAAYRFNRYSVQLDSTKLDKTNPQLNVINYSENFDVSSDNVLFHDELPYSGPAELVFNSKKARFITKNNKLQLHFPVYQYYEEELTNDYKRFKKRGKLKYPDYLNAINLNEIQSNHSSILFNELFPLLHDNVSYPYMYGNRYHKGKKIKYQEKKQNAFAKIITGQFKEGKPEGIWIVKDQFGHTQRVVSFNKGLMDGKVKIYEDIKGHKPKKENPYEYDYYYNEYSSDYDTLPAKNTHYLAYENHYKKGVQHGESIRYNWLGEIEEYGNYVDGYPNGKAYERNSLAYTQMNYLDGMPDGYVQTYLTLQGQDSILLFELNFQNGELQGESRSYHLNGKLSKRGFFMNGSPIDDYEAFDSLGVKYHYVKFLYSFPIEEKIWEENELSVRYSFDWRDSIYFVPSDITSSESLDYMLAKLGIGMDLYEQPYYGRPSLVDKSGIDYHMTKYYPNDTIARDGEISSGKKVGCWKYYDYEGELLYEVDYADSIITLNDSIQFKSKGVLTDFDAKGNLLSKSYIIEKFEKYDCSHTDHYEIRQLYTFWQANDTLTYMNGYVKNHYDNGVLQNEGQMTNGLPTGIWKFYDPFGKLNQVGNYVLGKRDGRWLGGDLSKTKYLGDICLNPNLPDLEAIIKHREQQLDIVITNYKLGKSQNKEFYDINWGDLEKKTKKVEEE